MARTLQRNLLGGAVPHDPRVEIASFYRAGVRGLSVGGDWHDAFTPAPGHLMLVVGDIVGRGLEAASTMGRLRSAVRALARRRASRRRELLTRLDAFAELDEPARMTTLICVDIELASGTCAHRLGGPPPGAARERRRATPSSSGTAARCRSARSSRSLPRGEFGLQLEAGARLDPLHRRLDRAPRATASTPGFEGLVAEAGASRHLPLAEMIGQITRRLLGDDPADDDVCLMAVRLL